MLFMEWMDAYLFHSLHVGYFHAFLLSVFLTIFLKSGQWNTLRLSNSLDPDQFNKMPGLIWTNAFCKDNKQKAIAILTH